MDFLGIGPLELVFIILIAIIIFGPNDIVKAGKTAGKYLRQLVKSPGWQTFQQASKEVRDLPTKLMREAGLDELEQEIGSIRDTAKIGVNGLEKKDISAWVTPPDLELSTKVNNVDETETTSTSEEKEQS
jgi:Sec-independent protein translocase protein TatA